MYGSNFVKYYGAGQNEKNALKQFFKVSNNLALKMI